MFCVLWAFCLTSFANWLKGMKAICLRCYKVIWSCFQIILPPMFLQSTAFLILSLFFVVPSTKSGILTDKAAELIGEFPISHKIYSTYSETNRIAFLSYSNPLKREVESGCQWRGKAPFCEGSCIGWEVEERNSTAEAEKIFGSPCWTGEKAFCC